MLSGCGAAVGPRLVSTLPGSWSRRGSGVEWSSEWLDLVEHRIFRLPLLALLACLLRGRGYVAFAFA